MDFLYGILPDGRFLHGILLVIFPKKRDFFALNSTLVTMLKKGIFASNNSVKENDTWNCVEFLS